MLELRDDIAAFWRRLRSERADHKVTPSQLQALGHLRRHGPISAARLAHYEQVTPQSIARTISNLESTDLVTRSADPTDARAQLVAITDRGRSLLEQDGERRVELLAELMQSECTPHEREILFLAGRIMRQLAQTPRTSSTADPSVHGGSTRARSALGGSTQEASSAAKQSRPRSQT